LWIAYEPRREKSQQIQRNQKLQTKRKKKKSTKEKEAQRIQRYRQSPIKLMEKALRRKI